MFLAGPKYLTTAVSSQSVDTIIMDHTFEDAVRSEYLNSGGVLISGESDLNKAIPLAEGGAETTEYKTLFNAAVNKVYQSRLNTLTGSLPENQSYDSISGKINTKEENQFWPYKKLYIDTIDYNYWINKKKELNKLYIQWEQYDEKTKLSEAVKPTDKNGKEYTPYCDKYFWFPLDLFGITIPNFFAPSIKVGVTDKDGKPEYEEDPTKKTKIQKTEERYIALKDGYAYIPIGQSVTLQYTRITFV